MTEILLSLLLTSRFDSVPINFVILLIVSLINVIISFIFNTSISTDFFNNPDFSVILFIIRSSSLIFNSSNANSTAASFVFPSNVYVFITS